MFSLIAIALIGASANAKSLSELVNNAQSGATNSEVQWQYPHIREVDLDMAAEIVGFDMKLCADSYYKFKISSNTASTGLQWRLARDDQTP